MTRTNSAKKRLLGAIAGLFIGAKKPVADSESDKMDLFKSSTQRIGVRFSEKIRSVFRKRWIKIH
jgi:hypothetical protein